MLVPPPRRKRAGTLWRRDPAVIRAEFGRGAWGQVRFIRPGPPMWKLVCSRMAAPRAAQNAVDLDFPFQFPYCCHETRIVAVAVAKLHFISPETLREEPSWN